MTDARSSQLFARALDVPVPMARSSQFFGRVVFNNPSQEDRTSQIFVRSLDVPTPTAKISQTLVRALVKGRVATPMLRTWTYNQDGHDFYILRLGDTTTLVFDLTTEQWSSYNGDDESYWRTSTGINWKTPGIVAQNYGSNVICGDDTFGRLWVLDPELGYDESPIDDVSVIPFDRIATGQIIARGRNTIPCYQVFLTASLGDPAFTGAGVTLEYSDDQGHNYISAGTIAVNQDNYSQEFAWRSLGLISSPGRIFRITDDGAFRRIDGLDILIDLNDEG